MPQMSSLPYKPASPPCSPQLLGWLKRETLSSRHIASRSFGLTDTAVTLPAGTTPLG